MTKRSEPVVEEVMEEVSMGVKDESSSSSSSSSSLLSVANVKEPVSTTVPLALVPHRSSYSHTGNNDVVAEEDDDEKDKEDGQDDETTRMVEANRRRALVDSERQILLLMLLAQVCSLHDPTPRTFTVHVLSLYERGLLDYSSIRFLFDLGLVPTMQEDDMDKSLALVPLHHTKRVGATDMEGRAREVTDIRTRLEKYDAVQALPQVRRSQSEPTTTAAQKDADVNRQANSSDGAGNRRRRYDPLKNGLEEQNEDHADGEDSDNGHDDDAARHEGGGTDKTKDNGEQTGSEASTQELPRRTSTASSSSATSSSWAVDQHPLQLSRYQRDFVQLHRLGGGSFGDVYKVRNKLDNETYAMKRVLFSARGYSNESVQRVLREVQCLAKCDHVNCIRYYTSWLEPSWMTGGSSSSSSSSTSASPHLIGSADDLADRSTQRRLLADIQRLVLATNTPGGLAQMPQHLSIEEEHDEDLEDEETQELEDSTNNASSYGPMTYFRPTLPSRQDSYRKLIQTYDSIPVGGPPAVSRDDDDDDDETLDSEWEPSTRRSSRANVPAGRLWRRPSSSLGLDESDNDEETQTKQDDDDNDVSWDLASSRRGTQHSRQISPHKASPQQQQQQQQWARGAHRAYNYHICLFIQMQLCESTTLADWIRDPQERSLDQVWNIVHQIVAGLKHIHDCGIIHRDFKPSNIFQAGQDCFKIGDLGLSKLLGGGTTPSPGGHKREARPFRGVWEPSSSNDKHNNNNTNLFQEEDEEHHTAGVGTESYAAPEQIQQESYGPEVDIFSLGLVLLELFCPVTSAHERAVLFRQCRVERRVFPSVVAVAPLILACTDPLPAARPSIGPLQRELQGAQRAHVQASPDHLQWWKSKVAQQEQLLQEKDALIAQLQAQLKSQQEELGKKVAVKEDSDSY